MKTRQTLIVSICIMVLALIVTVVGVSAAWFGDILQDTTEDIIISSARPMGQASIDIASAGMLEGQNILTPAITKPGILLQNGVDPSTINVLDSSNTNLQSVATKVTVFFPFSYLGVGDSGVTDGKKAIKISTEGAYLYSDSDTVDKTVSFIEDFTIDFDIVDNVTRNEDNIITGGTKVEPTPVANLQPSDGNIYYMDYPQDDYAMYLLVDPGVEHYCRVVIYFNKVDEELNYRLIDTLINFVIKIDATERL